MKEPEILTKFDYISDGLFIWSSEQFFWWKSSLYLTDYLFQRQKYRSIYVGFLVKKRLKFLFLIQICIDFV